MADFLPFHVPDIDDEDIEAVVEVLRSGWLTTGSKANSLNMSLRQSGSALCSGAEFMYRGLHLALEAIGLT